MLAVEMMFSFYFGVYSGTMLGLPGRDRAGACPPPTCFSNGPSHWPRALFGTFTPFASTLADRSHR